MDGWVVDFGSCGVHLVPIGGVFRVGDPSVAGSDLTVPGSPVHLLLHGVESGIIVVQCGSPSLPAGSVTPQKGLAPSESMTVGSLTIQVLRHSNPASLPSPASTPRARPRSRRWAVGLGAACALITLAWVVESVRISQREQTAALCLADASMGILAEQIFGSGEGAAAFYDLGLRERWLDRILTVETKRESLKGSGYRLVLDEDPLTGSLRLLAEPSSSWWRSLLALTPRSLCCDLHRPALQTLDGELLDWVELGGESSGLVIPRRLARRGVPEGDLYNAQRYRGFTWPLRELAQQQPESLPMVVASLKLWPNLILQLGPDRRSEKMLWEALANLGEEESFLWESSPEHSVQGRPQALARQMASPVDQTTPSSSACGVAQVQPVGPPLTPGEANLESLMDMADRERVETPGLQ
jgi:hypothetical protein